MVPNVKAHPDSGFDRLKLAPYIAAKRFLKKDRMIQYSIDILLVFFLGKIYIWKLQPTKYVANLGKSSKKDEHFAVTLTSFL